MLCHQLEKPKSPPFFITAKTASCFVTPLLKWAILNPLHPSKPTIRFLKGSATAKSSNVNQKRSTCPFIEHRTESSKANSTYISNKVFKIWLIILPSIILQGIIGIFEKTNFLTFITLIFRNTPNLQILSINWHSRFKSYCEDVLICTSGLSVMYVWRQYDPVTNWYSMYIYIHECISILTLQTASSIRPLLSASNPHPISPPR